jgi:hypothetical protein
MQRHSTRKVTNKSKPYPNQLASKDIKVQREKQLKLQKGVCPLCKTTISPEDAALDHCHSTGFVRQVLHRWCNSVLGRVENWSKRVGKTDHITFLKNTTKYLEKTHTDIIHPTHGKKKSKRKSRKRKKQSGKTTLRR